MNPNEELTPERVEELLVNGDESELRDLLRTVLSEAFGEGKALPNETILLLNAYYELQNEIMQAEIDRLKETLQAKGQLDQIIQTADEKSKIDEIRKSIE